MKLYRAFCNSIGIIATEDLNPLQYFWPPSGVQNSFSWNQANTYLTLKGLTKTTEFMEDAGNNQDQLFLTNKYYIRVNSGTFNKSTCDE